VLSLAVIASIDLNAPRGQRLQALATHDRSDGAVVVKVPSHIEITSLGGIGFENLAATARVNAGVVVGLAPVNLEAIAGGRRLHRGRLAGFIIEQLELLALLFLVARDEIDVRRRIRAHQTGLSRIGVDDQDVRPISG